MSMQRLIPLAAAALLGGCVSGYTYHQGGGGDYYYGNPHVEYRYHYGGYGGYGGGWYGYGAYPYGYYPYGHWGAYPGYWRGYYGGYYVPGCPYWYDPMYCYSGPYKPRHPGHRPPPPPGPPPPGGVPGGGIYRPDVTGLPSDDGGLERPGIRNGNPPPRPSVRRMHNPTGLPPSAVRPRASTGLPPTVVRPATPTMRTPPPSVVQRPPPVYRPPAPAPVPRATATPSTTDRAVDRARTRSGAVDTP